MNIGNHWYFIKKNYYYFRIKIAGPSFLKAYAFTYSGIVSPELIVLSLILMAATPVGARISTLDLSSDPE